MTAFAIILEAIGAVLRAYLLIGCLPAAWMAFGLWWHGMSDDDVRRRAEASIEGRPTEADEIGIAIVGSRLGAVLTMLILWPAVVRDLMREAWRR